MISHVLSKFVSKANRNLTFSQTIPEYACHVLNDTLSLPMLYI